MRTEVESHSGMGNAEVQVHVLDAGGHEVLTGESPCTLSPGSREEVTLTLPIDHPHLWNGKADPYLYSVRVDLVSGKGLVDSVTQPLGLRSFKVDPDKGFFLNGRYLDLHGVSRHQDRLDKGWAISKADEAEDFALIRDLGCTAVRVAHYQQADSWYQRFDASGIIAWAEVPFVNEALATPEFLENAKQQLKELIRQNYNHPAICFWSCGNETRGADSDHVVAELAKVVKAEDPTRLSTYASNGKESEPKNWHTDVMDFNHYAGWYGGEFTGLGAWLDNIHALHPHSAFGISEYGAGANILQHEYPAKRPQPKGQFHPEEYQADLHEASWLALQARPYVWSKFVWNMFDFASDGRSEGAQPGRNDKGLVTYDRRVRKDAFFWYKSNWSDEPVVCLASRRFHERPGSPIDVKVYSNAPEVELAIKGASLGVRRSKNHIFEWKGVALVPGENPVTATARFGNMTLTDAVTWILASGSPAGAAPR